MARRVKALVIPTNAVFSADVPLDLLWIEGDDDTSFAAAFHDLVASNFQVVRGPDGAWLYVNEDGKALGLPENLVATALAHAANTISMADFIVGQVIVVGPPDNAGYDTDVPDAFLHTVRHAGCTILDSTGSPSSSS